MSGKGLGPLAGVKVLDLTSVLMGPYATQIFADLGADVIKIEGPAGDTTRAIPPGPEATRGAMFLNVNRGKRSLALDLKQAAARDAVLRLAEGADVFIHSMRAQAIARLGLDYEALRAANPKIIYANLYGYGRNGPYRDYPAYDDIVQAASGVVDLQARLSGGEPTYVANVIADKVSGLTGAYAVIAALFARERTGLGQEIEVPMFETMVSFASVEHLCGSLFDPPQGPPEYPRATSPSRRPYRTADGHVGVMIYNDKQWQAFFCELGNPPWSQDPMFASLRSRTENISEVLASVARELATRSTAEWMDLFRRAEIPATPIASMEQLLHDPHLVETGFWQERETEAGRLRYPGIPTTFSETPGAIGDPGPVLGADNMAVLDEAGFSPEEVSALVASGAVIS
ncbi:MAG: CoA transferase [Novosphingobium sp. 28-62-57]|uniref:CaiB/BaiF CoA transferase family protein n=1 Tax=unclassified Novosphingobium TaxID=2644732 RepID=UPI000BC6B22A|nr:MULTISPECIES: CoA transferase [unclassified Novosphingobium]OYW51407.1 MAG: CoA transferase [Novosphingobium sp. 12-62-10]OYZ43681.1 MAG: CoA transferase [Novosphingobium sp. 16-62-11]OZA40663.1 MAG: CoA transferase [Novosphingobium sp. 17-62-9]OYZ10457.1 MAG: CoA transferase [Novosphingobium sp. 28-62-57]HQS68153.1 CoA transferase [Novosphingobium sp.]